MSAICIRCPVSGQLIDFDKCLDCAHEYQGQLNPATGDIELCNFTWSQLHYMITQAEHRKNAGVSATMITGCIRQSWWNEHREYEIDPNKQVAAMDGTGYHHLMDEHPEPGTWAEQRLTYQMPSGRWITGAFDRLIPVPMHHRGSAIGNVYWIEDYKHKGDGKIFTFPPSYYTIQLNVYRYMIEQGAREIETGEWFHGQVTKLTLLPNSHDAQGKRVPVPLLDLQLVEDYIEECLSLFHEATKATPPPRNQIADAPNNNFCPKYCPHFKACRGVGGEPYDATSQLLIPLKSISRR